MHVSSITLLERLLMFLILTFKLIETFAYNHFSVSATRRVELHDFLFDFADLITKTYLDITNKIVVSCQATEF